MCKNNCATDNLNYWRCKKITFIPTDDLFLQVESNYHEKYAFTNEIYRLKAIIEELKEDNMHLRYAYGGTGYQEAKAEFDRLNE